MGVSDRRVMVDFRFLGNSSEKRVAEKGFRKQGAVDSILSNLIITN